MASFPDKNCQRVTAHDPHVYPAGNPKYFCSGHTQEPERATMIVRDGRIVRFTGVGAPSALADGEYDLSVARWLGNDLGIPKLISDASLPPGDYTITPGVSIGKFQVLPEPDEVITKNTRAILGKLDELRKAENYNGQKLKEAIEAYSAQIHTRLDAMIEVFSKEFLEAIQKQTRSLMGPAFGEDEEN